MRDYKISELQSRFASFGFIWGDFHLIGIRSKADKANEFDDVFYLIEKTTIRSAPFVCTTNSGKNWLMNFMNPKGCAVLASDSQFVDCWALGKHNGKYEALVQVRPLNVFRDTNKDLKSDEIGKPDFGLFGINIHRAGETFISKTIDKWSAGCQVFQNPADFKYFMDKYKASGKKFLTYTLLKEF